MNELNSEETADKEDNYTSADNIIIKRNYFSFIVSNRRIVYEAFKQHQAPIQKVFIAVLLLGYLAYFSYAIYLSLEDALVLLIGTAIILSYLIYSFARDHQWGSQITKCCVIPVSRFIDKNWHIIKWVIFSILSGIHLAIVIYLSISEPLRLVSTFGIFFLMFVAFLFSTHPSKVSWRTVIWGYEIQFFLGFFVIATEVGYIIFDWIGDQVYIFLNYASAGSKFLFGENYSVHFFAFEIFPIIIYFSSVISICYYLGLIQFFIEKLSWLMKITMKTSVTESLNAAGSIFFGFESQLLVRPFLADMTLSELHAVMTAGFATMDGSTIAAYISFGIDPGSLIAASVMSAPASLAISKLIYPETERSKHISEQEIISKIHKSDSIYEAAISGARVALTVVSYIAVMLISFISLLEFINAVLSWIGQNVGYPELSFELICSYMFLPIALLMGVELKDCHYVAELLGIKIFLNEFIAFQKLAEYIENGTLTPRSEIIATYALCGFDNLGSVALQIGTLTALIPHRKKEVASISIRALVAGSLTCFSTACLAGLLYMDYKTP